MFQRVAILIFIFWMPLANLHATEFKGYQIDGSTDAFASQYEQFSYLLQLKNRLSICSWNIEEGTAAGKAPDEKLQNDLFKNLKKWAEDTSLRPDVLILLESRKNSLPPALMNRLNATYLWHQEIPYQEKALMPEVDFLQGCGAYNSLDPDRYEICRSAYRFLVEAGAGYEMLIYSAHPMQLMRQVPLDWLPGDAESSPADSKLFRNFYSTNFDIYDSWERPYVHFKIRRNELDYHVVPIHIVNPWMLFAHAMGFDPGGMQGKELILRNLIAGGPNPHEGQLFRLLKALKEDHLLGVDSPGVALVGDFNSFNNIALGTFGSSTPDFMKGRTSSYLWKLLSSAQLDSPFRKLWSDSFEFSDADAFSYPTLSSASDGRMRKVLIDQMYFNGNLTAISGSAQIFRLRGSDHYPICGMIKQKKNP